MDDRGGARTHRPRADDYFVARLEPDRSNRGHESGCPRVHRYGVRDAEAQLARSLELTNLRPSIEVIVPGAEILGQQSAFDDLSRGFNFLGADRVISGEGHAHRFRTSENR